MAVLPEHGSPKAARILAAASELMLGRGSRGVTIAEVAHRAHVAKGTVYLYWNTKEDLLVGLVVRDVLAFCDEVTNAVSGDPGLARPSRLCPYILRAAAGHPYVRALMFHDDDLLGALTNEPRLTELMNTLGPQAIVHLMLPIWREANLARTDWTVADQAFALHVLASGFVAVVDEKARQTDVDPDSVLSASVSALVGSETVNGAQIHAVAEACRQAIDSRRSAALADLGPSTSGRNPSSPSRR
ncbi:TetR/AcrR family transcriptional regulator [Rhodococcus qingshengii]|uniref:TetR/AcrR family transcriptional regulator n=1 Tax=Rhodococcus qingshengii TaxID=334542 RepID=UPI001BE6AED5|nr:TetR/AcrR family transcriptional regulator [Rhodococcus qingshengii]MBT2276301.1 TetR/AcrR family transcriptional regulator [Rhodococcus qingshengii]